MRGCSYLRAVLFGWLYAACACSPPPDPIAIDEGTIVVLNRTSNEWRNVVVIVNDHFRGGAPTLAPGGRLTAPLSQFQTAYGQRFDTGRQNMFRIEVTATGDDGVPVRLEWGTKR